MCALKTLTNEHIHDVLLEQDPHQSKKSETVVSDILMLPAIFISTWLRAHEDMDLRDTTLSYSAFSRLFRALPSHPNLCMLHLWKPPSIQTVDSTVDLLHNLLHSLRALPNCRLTTLGLYYRCWSSTIMPALAAARCSETHLAWCRTIIFSPHAPRCLVWLILDITVP